VRRCSIDPAHFHIVDDEAAHRFEARTDDDDTLVGELVYSRNGEQIVLVHTGVPKEFEHHGIGGQLVEAAIEEAMTRDLVVVPRCPFAREWLDEHPELAAKVRIASL
jgi:predicted GNAT family acetyltransferase